MSAEQNKALVRRYFEAISGKVKTLDIVNQFVADKHLAEHIVEFEASFPRYELIAEDMVAEGDKILVRGKLRGKHEGMFQKLAPTHKNVEVPMMVLYRLANNKIVEFWLQVDTLQLMQQLGAVPQAA